jgi:hypothetical protein
MKAALVCQLILLLYHQITTWIDLFPFNGARNYSRQERLAEAGANALLMGLAPLGFAFDAGRTRLIGGTWPRHPDRW